METIWGPQFGGRFRKVKTFGYWGRQDFIRSEENNRGALRVKYWAERAGQEN